MKIYALLVEELEGNKVHDMPSGFYTTREKAEQAFVEYMSRSAFAEYFEGPIDTYEKACAACGDWHEPVVHERELDAPITSD